MVELVDIAAIAIGGVGIVGITVTLVRAQLRKTRRRALVLARLNLQTPSRPR